MPEPKHMQAARLEVMMASAAAAPCLQLDVTVDEKDYETGAKILLKSIRPAWRPEDIVFKVSLYRSKSRAVWPIDTAIDSQGSRMNSWGLSLFT